MSKTPIIRDDDNELLGFVASDSTGWTAQTLFGYVFERTETKTAAEKAVREQGLSLLAGAWQYFDRDDRTWYPCKLKEVYENRVVVIRTTAMGYEDPDTYKQVTINNPSETTLVKS